MSTVTVPGVGQWLGMVMLSGVCLFAVAPDSGVGADWDEAH